MTNGSTLNTLDEEGLESIFSRTIERFEIMHEGAESLTKVLREKFDVETTYKPGDDAYWIGTPYGNDTFVLLSRTIKRLEAEAEKANMAVNTYLLWKMMGFNNLTIPTSIEPVPDSTNLQ